MIFFLILVLTNSVLSCTKPNLVYKAYDSRKEKRIGNQDYYHLSVTKLQYFAWSQFSLQEMMTSVALGPTHRQVLSQGGYFLPHDSPVDNTFRSD